jgi:hypothetical protein
MLDRERLPSDNIPEHSRHGSVFRSGRHRESQG